MRNILGIGSKWCPRALKNRGFSEKAEKLASLSPNGFHFNVISPSEVTETRRSLPAHIQMPDYALTGTTRLETFLFNYVDIKTEQDLRGIRTSCSLASKVLNTVAGYVKPGVSCQELDDVVYETCLSLNCYPSPLNYRGFPKSVTTSVNNVAVHGIPDARRLEEGDIITVDVSVFYDGFHGDTAATYPVGSVDEDALHLIRISELCLKAAIAQCLPGNPLNIIGKTIEEIASQNGLNSIPDLCGHGVGKYFHGPPQILHFDCDLEGDELMVENMVFTIEPVLCEGEVDVLVLEDGWTVITADKSRSAQFEHTICIKPGVPLILT